MELLLWLWSQLRSCGNNLPALGIALTIFALLFDFLKRRKSWSRYPPGPSSLPFFGTMLHIDFHNPHVSFTQGQQLPRKSPEMIERLNKSQQNCHPFDPHFLTNNAVSNVICSFIYGERFDYDNKKFQRLLHLVEQALKEEGGFLPQLLVVVPWLLRIPGVPQSIFRSQKEVLDFTNELVKEHRTTWNPTQKRDFTDAFLQEIEKAKEHAGSSFNDNNLPMVTVDLFTSGTETTSITLCWALLYMLLHPDIQCKVHEEIDKVIGRDRLPQMEDQANMPYTSAVIYETQCYGDITPVGMPRMTYRDTDLQGFFIPKGMTVITNLSSVLKDETVWEKPHQFYPEYFLDADGQFMKREAFLPFSAGKSKGRTVG
ncbi:cytochrome P450 2D17-like [Dermochelys coriacea]|uniref:cytochrome P450 2D17-like n=1 Tax=Dermochelys coriacea TaxID=27794 RepID=UPI001CA86E90|nr:cytochrome P450 2D17-like [Dermochelys coriacea]